MACSTFSALISSVLPSLLTVTVTSLPLSLDRLDLGPGQHLDAELLELLLDLLGDLGVLVGQGARQELDDGDVDAVVLQHVAELHADRAGAGDDDRRRQLARQDQLFIGDHVVRQRRAGHQPGAAAGGDDDVVERHRLGAAIIEFTSSVWSSVNVPYPWISVILFFFIRKCTPATRPSATLRLRSKATP